MSILLDMLNQMAATRLAGQPPADGPFTARTVRLTADGIAVTGDLRHGQMAGPVAVHVTVEPVAPDRFTLHVTPEQVPRDLAPELAAYRDVLERLRLHVDLDFSGPATGEVPS
jgi:hypothetical protein